MTLQQPRNGTDLSVLPAHNLHFQTYFFYKSVGKAAETTYSRSWCGVTLGFSSASFIDTCWLDYQEGMCRVHARYFENHSADR